MPTRIENGKEVSDTKYNGWTNYATWNVALYINNEERLYRAAREYMQIRKSKPSRPGAYRGFARRHLGVGYTPDGVKWTSVSLDYAELDEMMAGFAS